MPTFTEVRARWRPSEAQLLDRNDDTIDELRIDPYGRRFAWTPLDQISPALTKAIIAAEDHRFWSHRGVDIVALGISAARAGSAAAAAAPARSRCNSRRLLDPSLGRTSGTQSRAPKIQANLCGDRDRTAMVEASNPGSVPEPCDLSRRIAGNRRGLERDVRQSATGNRLRRGRSAGGFDPRTERPPRNRRDPCQRAEPLDGIVELIAGRH